MRYKLRLQLGGWTACNGNSRTLTDIGSRLAVALYPALKHSRATTASLNLKITGELVVGGSEKGIL